MIICNKWVGCGARGIPLRLPCFRSETTEMRWQWTGTRFVVAACFAPGATRPAMMLCWSSDEDIGSGELRRKKPSCGQEAVADVDPEQKQHTAWGAEGGVCLYQSPLGHTEQSSSVPRAQSHIQHRPPTTQGRAGASCVGVGRLAAWSSGVL